MARILIADDRAAGRELIRSMLECIGHDVDEAENGAQVFVRMAERKPDLVLLDLQMPVMNGFEVARAMQADPDLSRVPAVAVTASAMQGDREKALQQGFSGYLTKPLRLAELRKELDRLLNR